MMMIDMRGFYVCRSTFQFLIRRQNEFWEYNAQRLLLLSIYILSLSNSVDNNNKYNVSVGLGGSCGHIF